MPVLSYSLNTQAIVNKGNFLRQGIGTGRDCGILVQTFIARGRQQNKQPMELVGPGNQLPVTLW